MAHGSLVLGHCLLILVTSLTSLSPTNDSNLKVGNAKDIQCTAHNHATAANEIIETIPTTNTAHTGAVALINCHVYAIQNEIEITQMTDASLNDARLRLPHTTTVHTTIVNTEQTHSKQTQTNSCNASIQQRQGQSERLSFWTYFFWNIFQHRCNGNLLCCFRALMVCLMYFFLYIFHIFLH